MAVWKVPIGITVTEDREGTRARQLAQALASPLDVTVSTIHLETNGTTDEDDPTPAATLAEAIADHIGADQLLVVESVHADRWRSRGSVAEHLIDAHPNTSVAIGPASRVDLAPGPIVVALDGSDRALAGLAAAEVLAEILGRSLLLTQVIPESQAADQPAATHMLQAASAEAGAVVTVSNDPISALVSTSTDADAALIVLASSGDRETARASMSRTTAGLVAEAPCPVVVVPPAPEGQTD